MKFNDRDTVEGMSFAFLVAFLINGLAIAASVNILYPTLAFLAIGFFVRLLGR